MWRLAAFPRRTESDWQEFLALCEGTPSLVVTDFDVPLRNALASTFPRAGDRAPELRVCELHPRRRLKNALAPLADDPEHPVMRAFGHALYHHENWDRFVADANVANAHATPPLPGPMRWLDNYGELVATQLETRSSLGPNSIGACEALLHQVEGAFHGRSQSFGNRARLNLLLDLITLHHNGDADPLRWADWLRERLHHHGGTRPRQRPHDDPRGTPSPLA